ncbi:RNA polymerase sigma factor [Sessilibacter corallicola]|uniref:RNA polymerase sigma factor n=1 Tax=Sessilibacter corallicola TaxID=2904075 RepID=A0ABQ0A6W7_9GAMM
MNVNNASKFLDNVNLAKGGDIEAFTQLMKETQNTVSSIALAITKDLDNSEDVTQQVFIEVWNKLHTLKNSGSFLPWLRQISRYKAYNFIRSRKDHWFVSSEEGELILAQTACQNHTLEESMTRRKSNKILGEFIDELPAESREIVLLYYREEQSTVQVSQLLGISESNVRQRLSRIRKILKDDLLEHCGDIVLSTAPTIALLSFVISSIGTSAPVAASVAVSSIAVGKTGGLTKWLLLLGGAGIGALIGMLGVLIGSKLTERKIQDPAVLATCIRFRNYALLWMFFSGVVLTLSYELTQGWIAPVLAYVIFLVGLVRYTQYMSQLSQSLMDKNVCEKASKQKKWLQWGCNLGMLLGGVSGSAGLIVGLANSGRLSL